MSSRGTAGVSKYGMVLLYPGARNGATSTFTITGWNKWAFDKIKSRLPWSPWNGLNPFARLRIWTGISPGPKFTQRSKDYVGYENWTRNRTHHEMRIPEVTWPISSYLFTYLRSSIDIYLTRSSAIRHDKINLIQLKTFELELHFAQYNDKLVCGLRISAGLPNI